MKILGISAFYHDSAAAIVEDGKVIAAAQEERFSRIKHDSCFPSKAIEFCLDFSNSTVDQLDAIVYYEKPLLKFERLLETYFSFAPKGLVSFISAMPVWLKEKMFFKRQIRKELKKLGFTTLPRILFSEHHLSHAASAFYPSPYEESAILTIDGVGEWATTTISLGKGKDIQVLKELRFPHSLGLLYSAFTYFLGFKVNSGEYKLMGLAPYGNPCSEDVKRFKKIIVDELVDIKSDGSIWLNQKYFSYATGLRMIDDAKWEKLFNIKKREPEQEIHQQHCNLGLAIQIVTEEIVLGMAKEAKRLTNSENLCLAGGVALNCVSNGNLQSHKIFKNIFVQPAAGDAGGALGAALAAYHIFFSQDRIETKGLDHMQGSYLGPAFSDKDIQKTINKFRAVCHKLNEDELYEKAAQLISEGNVVGWMQGRMEFGPRALGMRSILGDARNPLMQAKLNLKIKYRESFRPFAPSVLYEERHNFFDIEASSPYMLQVHRVKKDRHQSLPADYFELSMKDKLYFQRSDIPSVTHINFSSRIQTVHKETNLRFWNLIKAFQNLTGYGLIINTSFNLRGEPIVCTPDDAYSCFMRTEMDYLIIENVFFAKNEQPEWKEKVRWEELYVLD